MTQADSVHSTPPLNTSANNRPHDSGSPQDSVYFKTDITPADLFEAIGRLRNAARNEINRLILFLDETDDCVCRELEDDDDREPDTAEPSLGSLDGALDQVRWAMGCADDTEHDPAESRIADRLALLGRRLYGV